MSVSQSDSNCASKSCKYKGLNQNNKLAVGLCSMCGMFEHFDCSKTKNEDRELILKGVIKYFCSECFCGNPAAIAFSETKSPQSRIKAIQTTTSAEMHAHAASFQCNLCNFKTKDSAQYDNHLNKSHEFICCICKEFLESQSELNKHNENNHNNLVLPVISILRLLPN